MKRELSIKDELRAIQSGELTCSPEKLAACAAYCRKRLDMLRRSLESQSVPAAYIEQNDIIQLYSIRAMPKACIVYSVPKCHLQKCRWHFFCFLAISLSA